MLSAVSVLLSEPYESLGILIVALGSKLDQQQGSRFLLSRVTASKVYLTKLFKAYSGYIRHETFSFGCHFRQCPGSA